MPSAVHTDTMEPPSSKKATDAAATEAAAAPSTPSSSQLLEESSRIFVKNLPPNITDDMLRKHFSGGGRVITDLKLIARRRIAFIGYQSAAEAAAAVRYFNRSYIRLSKLSVERAKPISDPSLPTAGKMQRMHMMHTEEPQQEAKETDTPEALGKKRKRDEELDVATNPKLREFLQVMQPQKRDALSSTADVLASVAAVGSAEEKKAEAEAAAAAAAAALAAAEGESDDEYESLPTRPSKKTRPAADGEENDNDDDGKEAESRRPTRVTAISATAIEEEEQTDDSRQAAAAAPARAPAPQQPRVDPAATDDDWLRTRTNRLLDLLDPNELAPPQGWQQPEAAPAAAAAIPEKEDEDMIDDADEDDTDNRHEVTANLDPANDTTTAPAVTTPSAPLSVEDQIRKTARLFVRNLPYGASEADLRSYFEAFGEVKEISLPVTNTGANKGFGMVLFADASVALAAFHNADGKTFKGRILHVLPAKAKKAEAGGEGAGGLDEFALAKLPLKQQRLARKKAEAASTTFAWNSLFMSQDAVNAAVADRLGVAKSAVLDPTSSDEAVKQAIRQTTMVEETKDYFQSNGVDLESFQARGQKRGDTCILVKHFAYGTTPDDLRKLFEEYGPVLRVLMPPSGTLAIVHFAHPAHGRLAYSKLAYRRINDTVLLLEKCPENVLGTSTVDGVLEAPTKKKTLLASDLLEKGDGDDEGGETKTAGDANTNNGEAGATSSVFVRNLNFTTTREQLAAAFSHLDGFVSARVKTRVDARRPGEVLSMGYGFVEFRTSAQVAAACAAMDGHILQGHTLAVRASHRGAQDAAEAQRAADRAKKLAANQGTKLVIKNVPFETTRKDLRTLLGTYGQLKAVRMPKKVGGGRDGDTTRGYAFAEFTTPNEAANAMAALRNTHLLGRRLVLEFAAADSLDAEQELARMRKKTGSQVDTVALRQLTHGRTHRTKVHIGEEAEEEA